jgi:hypothetical protein
MIEEIARTLSAAYDKLSSESWDELSPEEREFHSGMVCQLQNIIMDLGMVLQVPDCGQWYYDCGMRICGSKQYICESCKSCEPLS